MLKTVIYLFFLLISLSCFKNPGLIKYKYLELQEVHHLDIEDPSGLSRSHLPDHLFTVSDNSGKIYLINLQGEIIQKIDVNGDDLEGIEYLEEDSIIYVLEERLKWVISLKTDGTVIDTFLLDIPNLNVNDGPEGIAYNPVEKHFYIVNEKNPSKLYVYDSLFNLLSEYKLGFATDYSSADFEQQDNYLWILSHESKILARCNVQGVPDILYYTGVPKGEGVVVDSANQRVYIVCDLTSNLYIFKMP